LQAGHIKAFKDNWSVLTQDPWVLQTVQGYMLPLVTQPVQSITPPQMQFPSDQQLLISSEVESMLAKQAITPVQPSQGNFIAQIFVVEEHFKMEGFHVVKDLVGRTRTGRQR